MSFYPQTGSGVITQLPFHRTRRWRALSNKLESGEKIVMPDVRGGQILWDLKYEDLTDSEIDTISNLFTSCQGSFGSFTFVDPLANLLGGSETLTNASWESTELGIVSGVADPIGTNRASTVSNPATGPLNLSQTLGISGDYVASFSAYVQAGATGTLIISRDGHQKPVAAGPQWSRVFISGPGTPGATQSTFSLILTARQSVNIFGLQVEAQPSPSAYKPTVSGNGIYEETYFADDELKVTSTGVGFSRASINLISRI